MSLSLEALARYADEAEKMAVDAELRGQCLEFAAYTRRIKWHHSVRDEARRLADRFDSVAQSGSGIPRGLPCQPTIVTGTP